jgi:hypothetical protein
MTDMKKALNHEKRNQVRRNAFDFPPSEDAFRKQVDLLKELLLSKGVAFAFAAQELVNDQPIPKYSLFGYLIDDWARLQRWRAKKIPTQPLPLPSPLIQAMTKKLRRRGHLSQSTN